MRECARDFGATHVRRVADDDVEHLPAERSEPPGFDEAHVEREPSRVRTRDAERCGARVAGRDLRVRPRAFHGERDRAAARADVEHRRARQSLDCGKCELDEQLGLGTRDQYLGRYMQRQREELALAREIRERLAARAARDASGEALAATGSSMRSGNANNELRVLPVANARSTSASSCGVVLTAASLRAAAVKAAPVASAPAAESSDVRRVFMTVSSRGPSPQADRPGTRSRAARSRRRDRR